VHFKHVSAKIYPENLKQHFDCGGPGPFGPNPWLRPLFGSFANAGKELKGN